MSQRDLFRPMLAQHYATQAHFFPDALGYVRESDIACQACGSMLIETSSGYLACPNGHGKLLQEAVSDECSTWED